MNNTHRERDCKLPGAPVGSIGPRRRLSGAAPSRPLNAICATAAALVGVHAAPGVLREVPAVRLRVPPQVRLAGTRP
eukprot:15303528-Alexandrium_andersonii.AAC.1